MSTKLVKVIIDNRVLHVPQSFTVLQACEQAFVEVPRFCYHEKLSVAGNCRMCLVEVEKSPKPVVSCAMPVLENMRIYTNTPLVKKAREAVLEFLLVHHPLDCPICDQGGECDLQDQTLSYGTDKSRYYEYKRGVEDKNCGLFVKTLMTRCIHCTRCIRFIKEIGGKEELGTIGRGTKTEIGTYVNSFIKSELSGNLVDLCPVGALTSGVNPFTSRNWELDTIKTIDFFDAIGSNINIYTRQLSDKEKITLSNKKQKNFIIPKDQIIRILPRQNDNINENWISNKTRFSYDGITQNRLDYPSFVKNNKINICYWDQIFPYIYTIFHNNTSDKFYLKKYKKLVSLFGSLSDIESIYYLMQYLCELGSSNIQCENYYVNINIDIPTFYQFNSTIKNIEQSDVILLIGTNPRYEATLINARIKKHTNQNHVCVGLIGAYEELTYPVIHLGNSTKTLLKIAEGSHFFCNILRQAKNPIIILGSNILKRSDSDAIINLSRFIGKNLFLNLSTSNNYNILQTNVGQMNACAIGVRPGIRSDLFINSIRKKNAELLYLLEVNEFNTNKWLSYNKDKRITKVIANTSHKITNIASIDYFLPSVTPFEKTNLLVNVEGRTQQAHQAITTYGQARNVKENLKDFSILLKLNNNTFNKNILYIENPFLKKINKINQNFNFNYLNYTEPTNKLYLSNFVSIISEYYMTDIISKNSLVMSEYSLLLKSKENFIKLNELKK